jgi:hypothetical protein
VSVEELEGLSSCFINNRFKIFQPKWKWKLRLFSAEMRSLVKWHFSRKVWIVKWTEYFSARAQFKCLLFIWKRKLRSLEIYWIYGFQNSVWRRYSHLNSCHSPWKNEIFKQKTGLRNWRLLAQSECKVMKILSGHVKRLFPLARTQFTFPVVNVPNIAQDEFMKISNTIVKFEFSIISVL